MLVSADLYGLRAYCFRCKETATAKRYWSAVDMMPREPVLAIPGEEPQFALSPAHWLWLAQHGVDDGPAHEFGLYADARGDLALPFRGGVIKRVFDPNDDRKYILPGLPRSSYVPRWGDESRPIVLTEDCLSALRIGMAGGQGVALIGVTITAGVLNYCIGSSYPVYIWLDPDKWGRDGARSVHERLRGYVAYRPVIIKQDREPKEFGREELRQYLRARGCN